MNARIRQSQMARGLFALLLICALAIRVAVPTGFMPTQGIHGVVISLCTGQGAVKAVFPGDPVQNDQGQDGDHNKAKDGDCAFSAGLGGGLLAAPTPLMTAAPVLPVPLLASRAIADLTVHRLAAPPPPAQGPPAHA